MPTYRSALVLLFAISTTAAAQDCRLGVWNIERLSPTASRGFPELHGDEGFGPRTPQQLQDIAAYIRDDLQADALIVTEVEPDSGTALRPQSTQMDTIISALGNDWMYFLGRSGGKLHIGLIFNRTKVRVKQIVNLHADEFLVQAADVTDRDPLLFWIALLDQNGEERNDLFLIGLHLKSVQSNVHNHMAAMAKVFGDLADGEARESCGLPPAGLEDDVLLMGDLNDSAHKRTGFRYIFDYAEGAHYTHLGGDLPEYPDTRVNGSEIDHIFASRRVARDFVTEDSFEVHTVPEDERLDYRETFSDHFPVTVDLHVVDDDD